MQTGIPQSNDELLAKAQRLEGKKLYVKAAAIYEQLKMPKNAALAYESGGAWEQAATIYESLKNIEDAKRCRQKLEESKNSSTWSDLQADFVSDYPG